METTFSREAVLKDGLFSNSAFKRSGFFGAAGSFGLSAWVKGGVGKATSFGLGSAWFSNVFEEKKGPSLQLRADGEGEGIGRLGVASAQEAAERSEGFSFWQAAPPSLPFFAFADALGTWPSPGPAASALFRPSKPFLGSTTSCCWPSMHFSSLQIQIQIQIHTERFGLLSGPSCRKSAYENTFPEFKKRVLNQRPPPTAWRRARVTEVHSAAPPRPFRPSSKSALFEACKQNRQTKSPS